MAIGTRIHRLLTDRDVGSIVRWRVANSTARLALLLDADDVGAVAHQLDDNSYHILVTTTPVWVQLGATVNVTSSTNAPTVNDDELSGYQVGSLWIRTTPGSESFYCLADATAGAAVWVLAAGGGAAATWGTITGTLSTQTDLQNALDAKKPLELSGAGAPGVSTGNGRTLGTIYVDTTNDDAYTLVDATADANVWSQGGGGVGGGAGWDPTVLVGGPDLGGIWRPDVGILITASEVEDWRDNYSEFLNAPLTNADTLGSRPTETTLNGQPAIAFDETASQFLGSETSFSMGSDSFSMWFVGNVTSKATSGGRIWQASAAALELRMNGTTGQPQWRIGGTSVTNPVDVSGGTSFWTIAQYDRTEGTYKVYWGSTTPVTGSAAGAFSTQRLYMGGSRTGAGTTGQNQSCNVNEVGITKRMLTPTQIQNMADYFNTRYGL